MPFHLIYNLLETPFISKSPSQLGNTIQQYNTIQYNKVYLKSGYIKHEKH